MSTDERIKLVSLAIEATEEPSHDFAKEIGRIVWEADELQKRTGGGTMDWVEECFLPSLSKYGYGILPSQDIKALLDEREAEIEIVDAAVAYERIFKDRPIVQFFWKEDKNLIGAVRRLLEVRSAKQ